jgi:hypothetical protein
MSQEADALKLAIAMLDEINPETVQAVQFNMICPPNITGVDEDGWQESKPGKVQVINVLVICKQEGEQ